MKATDVEPAEFRRVLGQVPTTVTVITANTPTGPKGLVIGSFVSISLAPPLVGAFVAENSTSWPLIAQHGSFAVNVLADHQHELCARFASSGGEKFAGLDWTASPNGNPLLPEVTAWIDCGIAEIQRLGDHVLAVGRVLDLAAAESTTPLVFHQGTLRALETAD